MTTGLGMAAAGEDCALFSGGWAQDASAPPAGQRPRGRWAAPLLSARIPWHFETVEICSAESARARDARVLTGWDLLWGRDKDQACVKVKLGLYVTPYLLTLAPQDRSQRTCRNFDQFAPQNSGIQYLLRWVWLGNTYSGPHSLVQRSLCRSFCSSRPCSVSPPPPPGKARVGFSPRPRRLLSTGHTVKAP